MGKGELSVMIAASDRRRRRPSSVLQIFRAAARLLWMSRKPVLSIFLLVLLPYALLNLSNSLVVTPVNAEMRANPITMGTRTPEYYGGLAAALKKHLRELTIAEVNISVMSFLLSVFLLMAVVHTVTMAARGEQVTLRDLLCWISRAWKGPEITKIYVAIISSVCSLVILLIPFFGLAFISISISKGSILWFLLGGVTVVIAILLASLLLVYFQMVWYQGLVISVVEDCYGFAALGRASELIRGRRKLAFFVNFLLRLISLIISVTYYFMGTTLPAGKTANIVAGLAFSIVVYLPMDVFTHAVCVVFYDECRRGHRRIGRHEGELGVHQGAHLL